MATLNKQKTYGNPSCYDGSSIVSFPIGTTYTDGTLLEGNLNLKCLHLPNTVSKVHWNGIKRPSFERFMIDEDNPVFQAKEGVLYSKWGYNRDGENNKKHWMELVACPTKIERLVVNPQTKRIANCAFKDTLIREVVLPDGLIEIGANAFSYTHLLKEIRIPVSVCKIEYNRHTSF